MKIAVISIAKPVSGSGVGTTEYAYELTLRLKEVKSNKVDSYYAIETSKRNDWRLAYIYTVFPHKIKKLAKMDYDVVHITIQELGFVARILKQNGCKAKIVTTVHDLTRLRPGFHKGILQTGYNRLVAESIRDTIKYSDYIQFNSAQTEEEVTKEFGRLKNSRVVWHGTKREFFNTRIKAKKAGKRFHVGHIGAMGTHKNVIGILKVAEHMKDQPEVEFLVYGSGAEHDNIIAYQKSHNLHNVRMMGFAPGEKLVQIFDSFDLFFLPSMYEGLSHQLLEAQSRGIPCLIFKNAIIPEAVARYCFKAKDVRDAASIIKRLNDHRYTEKERKNLIKYSKKFSWDNTAAGTMKTYRMLTRKNK